MKQTTQVEDNLFSATHPHLYKQISVNQISTSSLLAVAGVVSIVISFMLEESKSTLSMALLSLGIMVVIFALYRLFSNSHEMVYKPTGSVIRSGSLYMDTLELQNFKQLVNKNDFSGTSRLSFKEGGHGRLDYMASKDGKFVAVQLFQFIPYTYEAVTGVYYYVDDEAVAVSRCMGI